MVWQLGTNISEKIIAASLFCSEDGGCMYPKKVGTFAPDYKEPQARTLAIFKFTITKIQTTHG